MARNVRVERKKKPGQSAMEYLMTYGWAILVIVIVAAVLIYMGILNPRGAAPNSILFAPGYSAYSFRLANGTGALELDFGHATGPNIEVTAIGCSMQDTPTLTQLDNPIGIPSGTHKWVVGGDSGNALLCLNETGGQVRTGFTATGERYRGTVCIQYVESDTGTTRTQCGSMSARFEPGYTGPAPSPPPSATPTPTVTGTPTATPTATPTGIITACPAQINEPGLFILGNDISSQGQDCISFEQAADGATLDCGGHTITINAQQQGGNGITLNGAPNVAIQNCNLVYSTQQEQQGAGNGLGFSAAGALELQEEGPYGIHITNAQGATVSGCTITGFPFGMFVEGSSGCTVSGNTIRASQQQQQQLMQGTGIYIAEGQQNGDNTMSGNTISGYTMALQFGGSGTGSLCTNNIVSGQQAQLQGYNMQITGNDFRGVQQLQAQGQQGFVFSNNNVAAQQQQQQGAGSGLGFSAAGSIYFQEEQQYNAQFQCQSGDCTYANNDFSNRQQIYLSCSNQQQQQQGCRFTGNTFRNINQLQIQCQEGQQQQQGPGDGLSLSGLDFQQQQQQACYFQGNTFCNNQQWSCQSNPVTDGGGNACDAQQQQQGAGSGLGLQQQQQGPCGLTCETSCSGQPNPTPTPTPVCVDGNAIIACGCTIDTQGDYILTTDISYAGAGQGDNDVCLSFTSGASGSTLDCHGSRITYTGQATYPYGIRMDGANSVTVQHCGINNFFNPIFISQGSSGNTITDNTMYAYYDTPHGGGYGIYLNNDASGNMVSGNTLRNFQYGIILNHNDNGNTISNNHVTGCNSGIYASWCYGNTFSGNTLSSNSQGIEMWASRDNIFTGNVANSNDGAGFRIIHSNDVQDPQNGNSFTGNTALGNSNDFYCDNVDSQVDGNNNVCSSNSCNWLACQQEAGPTPTPTPTPIAITGCPYTISSQGTYALSGDITSQNNADCITITSGGGGSTLDCNNNEIIGTSGNRGIYLNGASGVTIKDCIIHGFTLSGGIYFDAGTSNTITGNNVYGNYNGITLWSASNGNTLSGNTVSTNSNNGFSIGSTQNIFSGNVATGNSKDFGCMQATLSNTDNGNTCNTKSCNFVTSCPQQ